MVIRERVELDRCTCGSQRILRTVELLLRHRLRVVRARWLLSTSIAFVASRRPCCPLPSTLSTVDRAVSASWFSGSIASASFQPPSALFTKRARSAPASGRLSQIRLARRLIASTKRLSIFSASSSSIDRSRNAPVAEARRSAASVSFGLAATSGLRYWRSELTSGSLGAMARFGPVRLGDGCRPRASSWGHRGGAPASWRDS